MRGHGLINKRKNEKTIANKQNYYVNDKGVLKLNLKKKAGLTGLAMKNLILEVGTNKFPDGFCKCETCKYISVFISGVTSA